MHNNVLPDWDTKLINSAEIMFFCFCFFFKAKPMFIEVPFLIFLSADLPPVYTIEGIKREIKFYPPEYNTNTE